MDNSDKFSSSWFPDLSLTWEFLIPILDTLLIVSSVCQSFRRVSTLSILFVRFVEKYQTVKDCLDVIAIELSPFVAAWLFESM